MTKAPDKLLIGQRIHLNAHASPETINLDFEEPLTTDQMRQLERALSKSKRPLSTWNCGVIRAELEQIGMKPTTISVSPEPLDFSIDVLSAHSHPIPIKEEETKVKEGFENLAMNWLLFANTIYDTMERSGAHLQALKRSSEKETKAILLTKCEMVVSTVLNMSPELSQQVAKLARDIDSHEALEKAIHRLRSHIEKTGGEVVAAGSAHIS